MRIETIDTEMPTYWSWNRLDSIGTIVTGRTPSKDQTDCYGEDVLFVTPRDMDDHRDVLVTERGLSSKGAEILSNVLVPAESVAVSCIGSRLGKTSFIRKLAVTNQQINTIVVNEIYDVEYVYYVLSNQQDFLQGIAGGSAQPILNKSTFSRIEIPIPPLEEQRRIAGVLGALDDKIELNRQMNRTLEAIAQALFKSWFVDFDGHTDFEDSGTDLGRVPVGWTVGKMSDLANLNPTKWTKKTSPETIHYLTLTDTSWGEYQKPEKMRYEDAPSRARRILQDGDTIFGRVRPANGSYALIQDPESNLTGSTGFTVLRPKFESARYFNYLWITQQRVVEYLAATAHGSAYPAVAHEIIHQVPVVLPPREKMNDFHQIVEPLILRISANRKQSRTLAELRDTLLPKLISGEVRVPAAVDEIEGLL